ncbi:MAG: hypothetical protein U9O53_04715, partial [archaeon]|nr:hypothetical protein [archaeon]
MEKKNLSKTYLIIALVTVLILSIPALASHVFQSDTAMTTDGSDTWTEANDTESFTVTVNVTGDYLNQTNITVPCNSSGYANYSVNWSTLLEPVNWTCTNEKDASENISKIICQTTPGNETDYLKITFDATAFNLNDSFHNWTLVTMDNNASATNTTDMTTSIGISPVLFDQMHANNSWTNGDTQVYYINVTDYNLNTSRVIRHWSQNQNGWSAQNVTE